MKSNVNVFVGVVLCAVLCGTFVWLRSAGEEDTWKPNEIYDQVHSSSYSASYTNATFSGSPQDGGLAVSISSPSSMRARSTNFYAGAGYAPIASSPLASSPMGAASGAGLYTTSSAELKSFGGGGNGGAAMGGSARGNSVSTHSLQGGAGLGFSPISYTSARRSEVGGTSGTNPAMMVAENPAVAAMGAANAANGIYGAYSVMDYSGSANYAQYSAMFGSNRSNVRGRQNGDGLTDSWLDWLYRYGYTHGTPSETEGTGCTYTFTYEQLKAAYDDYINNYWDPMWSPNGENGKPTFEQWLAWLQGGGENGFGYNGNSYVWSPELPIGDIVPLLLLALLYVLFLAVKSKSLTSLLKTERSE